MSDSTANGSFLGRTFGSVFVRTMGIIAIMTVVLTVVGLRSVWFAGDTGTRILAQNLTEVTAAQSSGAIRFNKPEDITERLDHAFEASRGQAIGAIVFGADGTALSDMGDVAADRNALVALAKAAISTGITSVAEDRILVAAPVRSGNSAEIVGAVAMVWSSEAMMSQIMGGLLAAGVAIVCALLAAAMLLRFTLTKPLVGVIGAMKSVDAGDLDRVIPHVDSPGEVGTMARALDALRSGLKTADAKNRIGIIKSGGFEASSAAMMIANEDLEITFVNPAFRTLMNANIDTMRTLYPDFDVDGVIGKSIDTFHVKPSKNRARLAENTDWPLSVEARIEDLVLLITVSRVIGETGEGAGFVVEWEDVSEQQKTSAILNALESKQVSVSFDADWRTTTANSLFQEAADIPGDRIEGRDFDALLERADGDTARAKAQAEGGDVVFGQFRLTTQGGAKRVLDASLCPIRDSHGKTVSFVLLGLDITESEEKIAHMNAQREAAEAAQVMVVDALREGLSKLSGGDLTSSISDTFTSEYEQLRHDFNQAVARLDEAMGRVAGNSDTIRAEADSISTAAEDLSRRTERQASTLEETAAAVAELTASVASAAQGARQANDVVTEARDNAERSGEVVREAVTAMGQIETSSDQISKIISVIDDIAFQTNLLALNAGVEAARAGDAGRGFAVVASEVRALAQRSSDAAREINDLISTSGAHVKRGVELVDRTGAALEQIVASVTDISGLVSTISASATEQSSGLEEINTAMSSLDQVTQQNAAMFEETTAASQTLTRESASMANTMAMFRLSTARPQSVLETAQPTMPEPVADTSAPLPASTTVPEDAPTRTVGNLALAPEALDDDGDWEDF